MSSADQRMMESLKRRALQEDPSSLLGEQDSPDTEVDADMMRKQQQAQEAQALSANSAAATQASELSQVGGMATSAGVVGANPYVAGAGLGLQAVGMIDSGMRKSEQAKIDAYNNKIMAQRSAVRNMFS